MSDLFREVDEELQQDRLKYMARRFGPWVGVAVVVALLAAAVWTYMENQKEEKLAAAAERYFTALSSDGADLEILKSLTVEQGAGIYPIMANLLLMNEELEPERALETIMSADLDATTRASLARVLSYRFAHLGWQRIEGLVNQLTPAMQGASAELEFLGQMADNNMSGAKEALSRWKTLENLPASMAARLREAEIQLELAEHS